MTLAVLPPVHGRVLLSGTNLSDFDEDELRSAVSFSLKMRISLLPPFGTTC